MPALNTIQNLPRKFIDVSRETEARASGICKDHSDECYSIDEEGNGINALSCWMENPACGTCPLLTKGNSNG